MLSTGSSPIPLTPDYGGPLMHYADGVFDPHFDRYVTVMEGESIYEWHSFIFCLWSSVVASDVEKTFQIVERAAWTRLLQFLLYHL